MSRTNITPFHAKYYANELILQKASNDDSRISTSLFNSSLTINPHQIDAALFAFKSPLSKGVLLADEVGLGKTIEAGLVLCQLWSERKRHLLVICPAALRKQWSLELLEKFNLPSVILESKTYNEYIRQNKTNPFNQEKIVICSYQYAAKMYQDIAAVHWATVVIDEAHKLRNSYRESNKLGQAIKIGTKNYKKILLTATPLQNSLIELYGLSSVIDEYIFGDLKSFRQDYVNENNTDDLKYRISGFCKRTLRKDVTEYIKYTERFPIVKEFSASDEEQQLYDELSAFLQKEESYAIPVSQKQLTTLVIRKVMASSTSAVKQTLETILERLLKIQEGLPSEELNMHDMLDEDALETLEEEVEEIEEDDVEISESEENKIDSDELNSEIEQIRHFIDLAGSITTETKSLTLLDAIKTGFEETASRGGNKKALIFTESTRTQKYLKQFLEENGYTGKVCIFNGSNSGPETTQIYNDWKEKNKYTGRVSDSITADKRNAIIEHFRDKAEILIATESAAEGVNLQFCSLVINYDLPWNPQRIEQRIGRCHRYGQKNDVVVINFINKRNYADVRVHELLDEKFNLFRGVFGSSDEVLGTVESGIDFEQKILDIYQQCRTPEEITAEFDKLQKEMEDKIKAGMKKATDKLFENFDVDVHERLKLSVNEYLDRYTRYFWALSKFELSKEADFDDNEKSIKLKECVGSVSPCVLKLIRQNEEQTGLEIYRMNHPLGQYVLEKGLAENPNSGKIIFDISNHTGYKMRQVEQLKGKSGYLSLAKYSVTSLEDEEYLLFVGSLKDGTRLDAEQCQKLFECEGYSLDSVIPDNVQIILDKEIDIYADGTLEMVNQKNLEYVREEEEQLDKWTEDMITAIEKELDLVKKQIREAERSLRLATSTQEHLEIQEKLQALNKKKRVMRVKLEENEEEIQAKRDNLINEIKQRAKTNTKLEKLFTVEWEVR